MIYQVVKAVLYSLNLRSIASAGVFSKPSARAGGPADSVLIQNAHQGVWERALFVRIDECKAY
jgi:hypothetical protein